MELLNRLREIYGAYIEKTVQLQNDRKIFQGVLGFGAKLSDDPCHGQFAADVEAIVAEMAAEVSAEEAQAALEFMLKTPEEHKGNTLAYWMLLAVHGKTNPLVAKLAAEGASELLEWYEKQYPKRMRLPVQKDLVKQLNAAAK